ncbi:MAG: heme ABC transporter ATP-binding protein [Actinomycetales bacterium]|nr:heme ABC transporter ATP-binding protein [Actinomycetales bacterium]
MIQARGVGLRFGEAQILAGIDLDVRAGEVLALVGPNGAGKTSLLSLLAGDAAPTEGTVLLDGRPVTDHRPAELARRRGVLLQENRLSFPFEVVDVVQMGRAPWRGRPESDDDDAAVTSAMRSAEVVHLSRRLFPTLSGGEKSRVSFARVLAQDPRVIFLDEPTAALDIRHQERTLELARERARAGDAVVVVLHDLSLAAAYSDRMALLSGGRLVAEGAPREVLDAARLSAVYEHPVEVVERGDGSLLVLPLRTVEVSR